MFTFLGYPYLKVLVFTCRILLGDIANGELKGRGMHVGIICKN